MSKIKFLAMQIKLGNTTLDQIPEEYREAVEKELNK